jgi:hypothetical protein
LKGSLGFLVALLDWKIGMIRGDFYKVWEKAANLSSFTKEEDW